MAYERIAPLMGRLWSPVAAVTSRWQGEVNAQIAVTVGAASIVPSAPRVIVQIYKGNHSHQLIQRSGAFALNFLRPDQIPLVRTFGFFSGAHSEKLAGVDYAPGPSGSPILRECWAYLDCRVVNAMDGGDMTCYLGEVLAGDIIEAGEKASGPLWWRDARRELPPQWSGEWDRKQALEIERSAGAMTQIDYTPWIPARGTWQTGLENEQR